MILKPAPEAVRSARCVAECCWEAGVPRDVVQLLPCPDDDVGPAPHHPSRRRRRRAHRLVRHRAAVPRLAARPAAARGDERQERARRSPRPPTSTSPSATSCARRSATPARSAPPPASRSSRRRRPRRPALPAPARRRRAQPPRRPGRPTCRTDVGPLIDPPAGPLAGALTTLEPGESWLVEPRPARRPTTLWSPGVQVGVQPGSWFHRTECFGPVLGVMRARTTSTTAIALQNDTDVRAHRRPAQPRPGRGRALARRASRSATPT